MTTTIAEARYLPLDPDNMNDERAAWAALAINAFIAEVGIHREGSLAELLGCLRHWADRNDVDFGLELERADEHYEAETTTAPA